jgi:hypothetical protein
LRRGTLRSVTSCRAVVYGRARRRCLTPPHQPGSACRPASICGRVPTDGLLRELSEVGRLRCLRTSELTLDVRAGPVGHRPAYALGGGSGSRGSSKGASKGGAVGGGSMFGSRVTSGAFGSSGGTIGPSGGGWLGPGIGSAMKVFMPLVEAIAWPRRSIAWVARAEAPQGAQCLKTSPDPSERTVAARCCKHGRGSCGRAVALRAWF